MTPITDNVRLREFCDAVRHSEFIAVDTEFMRETTYWPKLCLIQAASIDGAAVIDPLADEIDLEPFLELMRDENVVKVFHACRQDVEIFHNLNAMPRPIFDTQVAAMAGGYGEQIAYDALMRQILKVEIDKSSRFTDWARRPLSDAQLTYAAGDVTHLAKAYPRMVERLERDGRLGWVEEEMEALSDPAAYDTDPENAWRRLKPRKFTARYLAAFKAAAAFRERAAQARDMPRGRVFKDEAMDEIASQLPTSVDQLANMRSLGKGFAGSRFGPELLEALKAALRDPEAYAPVVERAPPPPQGAGAVVELLKVLLKARAEDAGVASKLIATVGDLEKIAAGDEDAAALKGWRREVFGEDALRLKRGELALMLKGSRVKVAELV